MDTPHMFLVGPSESNDDKSFRFSVDKSSEEHESLLHYCNLDTLTAILSNMTLQLSSLDYIKLNDKFEKQLKGIEDYAKDCFVACFSHCPYEVVPFWYNYGGDNRKEKVLLVLNNFASSFNDHVHTDFFITGEGKKMYFHIDDNVSDESARTGKFNLDLPGIGRLSLTGRMRVNNHNPDFDSRSHITSLLIKDIEYLPIWHPVFEKVYKQDKNVFFPGMDTPICMAEYDINPFALYKTRHWDYEKETRIICKLMNSQNKLFDHIYLRLKESFFSQLIIVKNPWADTDFDKKVNDIILNSTLSPSVKSSIEVKKSELTGLLLE